MSNYTFETLNDKEFELLVRDLLQEEFKLTLESFKKGRDGGKDLRYSRPKGNNDSIVIQVKHYFKSGYALLKNKLIKAELDKVKQIKPERYILATSVSLTDKNKSDIKKIFSPYIVSTGDIYDLELLNNLLSKYPDVEKRHFKLWISSTNIIETIINNGIKGRSDFSQIQIIRDIKKYVRTSNYKRALKILKKYKFLTIIGEPGIGKTLTAKFIVYTLLANGFELVYIDEKIREGEDLFLPNKKQIFYFDDFLGSNYLELIQPKNSDSALLNFIERVKGSRNKYIILTSRTTILNQAKEKFFKLKDKRIDLSKHEINIHDYNLINKARILYNHLFFSDLQEHYINKIIENENYWKIIRHRNFNPRIIEFITDVYNVYAVTPQNYLQYIIDKLNNPHLIWQDAFEQQIDDYCKFLLLTLFSLPTNISQEFFQTAYDARLNFEINNNGYQRSINYFFSKIKELLGGFIVYHRFTDGSGYYNFFNPSIIDFIIYYLNQDPNEKWRILESAIYFEQLNLPFDKNLKNNINLKKVEVEKLLNLYRHKENNINFIEKGSKELKWIMLYINNFEFDQIIMDIKRNIEELDFENIRSDEFSDLIHILNECSKDELLSTFIISNWEKIFFELLKATKDDHEFMMIKTLFYDYNLDFDAFIQIDNRKERVQNYLDSFWDNYINYKIDNYEKLNDSYDINEAHEALESIYEDLHEINFTLNIEDSPAFKLIEGINLRQIVSDNLRQKEKDSFEDNYYDNKKDYDNVVNEVNNLFSK